MAFSTSVVEPSALAGIMMATENLSPGKVIVLESDGFDTNLPGKFLQQSRLSNLAPLAEKSGLTFSAIPNPLRSPAARSRFVTGPFPREHRILNFIGRTPDTSLPDLSLTEIAPGPGKVSVGGTKRSKRRLS